MPKQNIWTEEDIIINMMIMYTDFQGCSYKLIGAYDIFLENKEIGNIWAFIKEQNTG